MNWDNAPAIPPPPTFILMNFANRLNNNNYNNDNNNDDIMMNNYYNEKRFNFTSNQNFYDYQNAYFNPNFFNETFNFTEDFEIILPCSTNQNSISNIISMILYAIVCCVGLFGNTLVIYVVLRFSKMQTVTNIYILNLAIADECYLIGIPFLLITIHLRHWTFGNIMCKAYMVSTSITQFTSSIFLLIMSADRYMAVCHPISSQRIRTPFISKIVSIIAWMTSVIMMLPVILFSSTIEYEHQRYSCIIKWPEDHGQESGTTFTLYALILGFAIPLSFIMIFYCLVLRKLQRVGPKNKSKIKKRSHRKVTKLVLTVITIYILCWLPHWISQVALIHSSPNKCRSKLEITIFLLVGCLGYSNSAMNPILYTFLSDNFKKSFMKAFLCKNHNHHPNKNQNQKDMNGQIIQMDDNSIIPKFRQKLNQPNSNRNNCDADDTIDIDNGNFTGTGTTSSGSSSAINNNGTKRLLPVKLQTKRTQNLTTTTTTTNTVINSDHDQNSIILVPKNNNIQKDDILQLIENSHDIVMKENDFNYDLNKSGILHTDL